MQSNIDLNKIIKKSQYKFRGVLVSFSFVSGMVAQVLMSKGQGKKKKTICFRAAGDTAFKLSQVEPKSRLKVWFTISSIEVNNRWYTNLEIKDFESWAVNEDKLKKEAAMKQKAKTQIYEQSLFKP